MPRESNEPPDARQTPAALRETAARARRLAREISDLPAQAELIAFAEELEARLATLEPLPLVKAPPALSDESGQ